MSLEKQAKRSLRRVRAKTAPGGGLFRNDVPNPISTGGNPDKSSNAVLMRAQTSLERFAGGRNHGDSDAPVVPLEPGSPSTDADKTLPAAIPSWLVEKVRKSKKIAAALDLSGVSGDTRPYRDRVETYALDDDGQVLGGAYKGDLSFGVFGGGVDDGEDALEAAAREFGEEAGYELLDPRFVEVDPVTVDWSPPYASDKQAERAKKYRGSRTRFVTGRIGQPREKGRGDDADSGLDDIRFYDIDEADGMLNPETAMDAGLSRSRKAVLQALRAARMQKSAGIKVEDVVGKQRSRELRKRLRRDYDDMLTWLRDEFESKKPKKPKKPKQAGEDNEPDKATHASAPSSQLRSRSEVVIATPDGVLGIDKSDYILFPGGGVDDGEPAIVAAVREVIEEADVHVLNLNQRDIVESTWPEGVNDFWDDSDFDGERTYFFTAIDGGRLGTTHDDREDFDVIPYDTLLARLEELMEDESAWDHENNRVRHSLVSAAKGMVGREDAWKPKKLARAPRHTAGGWGHYRNALRKIFTPHDPKAFATAIQEAEDELGHHTHEVRRFPSGAVLVVLRTHEGKAPVTSRDHILARRINGIAKTAGAAGSGTMALTAGHHRPEQPAPGLLVDLDGTVVTSEWASDGSGILQSQEPRENVKSALEAANAAGMRIVGVTNRSADPQGVLSTPDDIERYNAEVMAWFPEISDIVFCGSADDADRKPSPAMLEFARHHFNLEPVLAMVGDSEDDAAAACAAGVLYLSPEEFFDSPECRDSLIAVAQGDVSCGLPKKADAASLEPRDEFFYTNPQGEVLARRLGDRRFDFPTAGKGKRAPYSTPFRYVPRGGVDTPGVHGYEYNFNVGTGPTPGDFDDSEWIPMQEVLNQTYGSMGLAKNREYRELDRARARVLHRLLRKINQSQRSDGVPEGDTRPEAAEPADEDTEFDLPAAVSSDRWSDIERSTIHEGL